MDLKDLLNIIESKEQSSKIVSEARKKLPEDLDELIDLYMQQNKIYHLEGMRGVRYLHSMVEILGYRDFDYFLEDNPGCQTAIVEWLKERNVDEWVEKFKEAVDLDEAED